MLKNAKISITVLVLFCIICTRRTKFYYLKLLHYKILYNSHSITARREISVNIILKLMREPFLSIRIEDDERTGQTKLGSISNKKLRLNKDKVHK